MGRITDLWYRRAGDDTRRFVRRILFASLAMMGIAACSFNDDSTYLDLSTGTSTTSSGLSAPTTWHEPPTLPANRFVKGRGHGLDATDFANRVIAEAQPTSIEAPPTSTTPTTATQDGATRPAIITATTTSPEASTTSTTGAEAPAGSTTTSEAVKETTTTTSPGTGLDKSGRTLATAKLTMYWVTLEADFSGAADTTIRTCGGEALATVPRDFAKAARLESTGRLNDGRTVYAALECGCSSGYSCFSLRDPKKYPWGIGSRNNALIPFRSVATDPSVIKGGTVMYSPELDGMKLPDGSSTHDGCVRADDTGGAIKGARVDWFVALKVYANDFYDIGLPNSLTLIGDVSACQYLDQ